MTFRLTARLANKLSSSYMLRNYTRVDYNGPLVTVRKYRKKIQAQNDADYDPSFG